MSGLIMSLYGWWDLNKLMKGLWNQFSLILCVQTHNLDKNLKLYGNQMSEITVKLEEMS